MRVDTNAATIRHQGLRRPGRSDCAGGTASGTERQRQRQAPVNRSQRATVTPDRHRRLAL